MAVRMAVLFSAMVASILLKALYVCGSIKFGTFRSQSSAAYAPQTIRLALGTGLEPRAVARFLEMQPR
jgi:hypothetical protein